MPPIPIAMPMSRLRAPFAALAVALLVSPATGQDAPAPAPQTLLGIVNDAGVVTSIVRFDGARWRSSWPAPDDAITRTPLPSSLQSVPIGWTGVPLPERWYAWPRAAAAATGGGTADREVREIRVTRPVRYDAHCMPGFGLQVDPRELGLAGLFGSKRQTEAHAFPKRKVALALSNADVRVERIDDVRTDAASEREVLRAAATLFRANVKAAAARDGRTLSSDRLRVQWTSAWSYALPDSDERIYLLEGHDRDTPVITGFVWLRTKGRTPVEHRGRAVIDDEDFKQTVRRKPMGVIASGSRRLWFSEVDGYESEAYELIDLASPRLPAALTIPGGGC
jgi:hypothetical protein